MAIGLAKLAAEDQLDHVYVCKWCGKTFMFRSVMDDHRKQHYHTDYAVLTANAA